MLSELRELPGLHVANLKPSHLIHLSFQAIKDLAHAWKSVCFEKSVIALICRPAEASVWRGPEARVVEALHLAASTQFSAEALTGLGSLLGYSVAALCQKMS